MAIDTKAIYLLTTGVEHGKSYEYIDLGSKIATVVASGHAEPGLLEAGARGDLEFKSTNGQYYRVRIQRTPGQSILTMLFGGVCIVGALLTLGIRAAHKKLGLDDQIALSVVGGVGLIAFGVGAKRTWWPAREWVLSVDR
jgi:hypothetical protein